MSFVRSIVTLSVAVLAAVAFTGCIGVLGSHADGNEHPAGLTDPSATGSNGGSTPPLKITVFAPLRSTITGDSLSWVANGTTINVRASPIQGAVGDVQERWYTGALSGTAAITTPVKAQSQYIEPGGSSGIRFNVAGKFFMHCHPHPWMRSNVTVVEGWQNPDTVVVNFVDGATPADFRFVPENVTVHPGTTVVYHNLGQQTHIAMQLAQDAPLKPVPITGLSGAATIQGLGWQRIVLLTQDSEGRTGESELAVYSTPTLPGVGHWYFNLTTNRGAPDAAPGAAGGDFDSKSFKPDYNGTMYVNYTARSAPQAALYGQGKDAPDPVTKVQIHVKEAGIDQDVLSGESAQSGNITGRSHDTIHTITAKADTGAGITTEVEVTVVYDLTPPAPSAYFDPESIPHTH